MLESTLQYQTQDLLVNDILPSRLGRSNENPQNLSALKQNRIYISFALHGYYGIRRGGEMLLTVVTTGPRGCGNSHTST